MRYSIESYIKDDNDCLRIHINTADFKQYVEDKLNFYPIYLATEENRKWMKKKLCPSLIVDEVAGSQRILINEPICLRTYAEFNSRESQEYREQTIQLLVEYMEESLQDFKARWAKDAEINRNEIVDIF